LTRAIQVFSTCPPSVAAGRTAETGPGSDYRARVAEVARWSEAVGCEGILVYTDNRLVDPWLTAQLIIEVTERLSPLVAVQPAYMHPYSVAKMVATLCYLYNRKIYLNMVAGGFKRDLEALNDFTEHDERYTRLVEYSRTIKALTERSSKSLAFSCEGTYYPVNGLKLIPPIPPGLLPEFFVSGSSEAGAMAAGALDATAVQYPRPVHEYSVETLVRTFAPVQRRGIRVGIIARDTSYEAWRVAEERFPPDRRGEVAHSLAMKTSDSRWHEDLSERPAAKDDPDSPYWLRPFRSYQTFCPYLVGSYDRVAKEIARYITAGFQRFILDIPPNEFELDSAQRALDAGQRAAA
jgi:alkanesulfonate monooxygenase